MGPLVHRRIAIRKANGQRLGFRTYRSTLVTDHSSRDPRRVQRRVRARVCVNAKRNSTAAPPSHESLLLLINSCSARKQVRRAANRTAVARGPRQCARLAARRRDSPDSETRAAVKCSAAACVVVIVIIVVISVVAPSPADRAGSKIANK